MKKILLIACIAIGLMACNDNSQDSTQASADSTDHNSHQNQSADVGTQADTSGMTGKSMSAMMNSMMDDMKNMKSSGSPDNDFANLMKAHHMGAIEMAQIEVATGTDTQVKQMAQKMVDDQQKEVAEFNTFLSGHNAHGGGGGEAFFKEAMGMMSNMKMDMDHSGGVDKQFVQMMIPHHQSAIDMSKAYIKTGAHEAKLKTMANNIITSQQKEIKDLQTWLAKNK